MLNSKLFSQMYIFYGLHMIDNTHCMYANKFLQASLVYYLAGNILHWQFFPTNGTYSNG